MHNELNEFGCLVWLQRRLLRRLGTLVPHDIYLKAPDWRMEARRLVDESMIRRTADNAQRKTLRVLKLDGGRGYGLAMLGSGRVPTVLECVEETV
jgi:hypothetical protein